MRDLIVRIEERVKEADLCNRRLYRLLDESEHDCFGSWFLEIEQRAEDAVAIAKEHLEERNEEPPSILCGSVAVSSRRSSKLRVDESSERAHELHRQSEIRSYQAKQETARRECEEMAQRVFDQKAQTCREILEETFNATATP